MINKTFLVKEKPYGIDFFCTFIPYIIFVFFFLYIHPWLFLPPSPPPTSTWISLSIFHSFSFIFNYKDENNDDHITFTMMMMKQQKKHFIHSIFWKILIELSNEKMIIIWCFNTPGVCLYFVFKLRQINRKQNTWKQNNDTQRL